MAAEVGLESSPVNATAFVKMFVGLLLTIGIIFLIAWFGRKTNLMNNFSSGYQIKSLAMLSLTQREKLCLVEVGETHILVSVAPGSVNKIHVFDSPIEAEQVAEIASGNFAEQFKKALRMQPQGDKS
ncbi:MAG: flagellar biosynthetic protein FliO [Gammaproteobacteria bacterium]|nr:flagellar biosynthetic protein FliO [Gammaproteobacteria bacterium]NNJ72979.1 flagellar biosynthetic protein FliO [Enterobacterales bacterium]